MEDRHELISWVGGLVKMEVSCNDEWTTYPLDQFMTALNVDDSLKCSMGFLSDLT